MEDSVLQTTFCKYFKRFTEATWQATLGLTIPVADVIFDKVQGKVTADDFLMTLNFLKEYRTHEAMAATWDLYEDTVASKVWSTLTSMDNFLPKVLLGMIYFSLLKIDWQERFHNPPEAGSLFSHVYTIIDGTLCETEKPINPEEWKDLNSGNN